MSAMTDRLPLQAGIRTDGWVGIVDDDASIRQSLARMFRGHGIRAETFGSAEDYLHHSALVEPRCIVLDVHLGGLNGFELQARLAAEGKLPPIVFITAHEIGTADLARCPGPCRYLRKPFDSEALVALVLPHFNSHSPK